MYRVEISVIDDGVPQVGMDRPEVVKALSVGSTYPTQDLAEKDARGMAHTPEMRQALANLYARACHHPRCERGTPEHECSCGLSAALEQTRQVLKG